MQHSEAKNPPTTIFIRAPARPVPPRPALVPPLFVLPQFIVRCAAARRPRGLPKKKAIEEKIFNRLKKIERVLLYAAV